MLLTMNQQEWQILRIANREGVCNGRTLRFTPSRKTKDGSFLTSLVKRKLMRVVTPNADPFEATYELTPQGELAAEYGEYQGHPETLVADAVQTNDAGYLKKWLDSLTARGRLKKIGEKYVINEATPAPVPTNAPKKRTGI